MKIPRKIHVDIEMSPEDIADCFCDLYADEQAIFFNRISEVVTTWGTSFCFQFQSVVDSKILTSDGKEIIRQMGKYGSEI